MQYKLIDRSGVDDDDSFTAPAPPKQRQQVPKTPASAASASVAPPPKTEIHVCVAGTCVARGSQAVLTEIEELVNEVGGNCAVRKSGCLGYCNQAPNAVVAERGGRRLSAVHTQISLEASAKVVTRATGKRPDLDDAGTRKRLAGVRAARARQHAASVSKWNTALHGLAEQVAQRPGLRPELLALLGKAGFPQGVSGGADMPSSITNYSPWSLESVTPVSKHSAIFRLTSADKKRGTPHPRGARAATARLAPLISHLASRNSHYLAHRASHLASLISHLSRAS